MTKKPANGKNPVRSTSSALRFLAVCDIAEYLGVSTRTVRRWIKSKMLVAHKFGGVLRIAEDDLRVFLARYRGI